MALKQSQHTRSRRRSLGITGWSAVVMAVWFVLGAHTAAPVAAQTDPSILSTPWGQTPHWAQTDDQLFFIFGGNAKGTSSDVDIFVWDSQGRIKFNRDQQDPKFVLGYRVLTVGIDSPLAALPTALNDVSVVGAYKLGELIEDWNFSLTGGLGSANDDHWENSDSFYTIGAIEATHALSENQTLIVGLSYNGNRTFLPDVPLPYGMIEHRVSPTLIYRVGVPTSMIIWNPTDPVTVKLSYFIPTNVAIHVDYVITEKLGVFMNYDRKLDAFYLDGTDNTRLFYDVSSVLGGVRFTMKPLLELRAGVGWAFDQEFSTGFDVRNTTTLVKPTDNILFFVMIEGTF